MSAVKADVQAVAQKSQDLPEGYTLCLSGEGGDFAIPPAAQGRVLVFGRESGVDILMLRSTDLPASLYGVLRDIRTKAALEGRVCFERVVDPSLMELLCHRQRNSGSGVEETLAETDAAKRFEKLLIQAADEKASDIHLMIRKDHAEVAFRIHGEIVPIAQWTKKQAEEMASCAYNVMGGNREVQFSPSQRQDANIQRMIGGRQFMMRYAHAPLYPAGVHSVLRILQAGKPFEFAGCLTELGYTDDQARRIEDMAMEPSGILLISGETGAGKSTTLANLLHIRFKASGGRINILTVEDPPEYEIPGICQSPVSTGQDRGSLSGAIRSAMRRDPDLLMIGEIRDLETALLAAQFAQSGHSLLSTIHASRALDIIPRLEGIGASQADNPITRRLLCGPRFITGLVHQVLVPMLCTHCRIPWLESPLRREHSRLMERLAAAGINESLLSTRGAGCPACREGIQGRKVTAEVVQLTPEIRSLMLEGHDEAAFSAWLRSGGYSIWMHAIDRLQRGEVCPVDLEETIGLIRNEKPPVEPNS